MSLETKISNSLLEQMKKIDLTINERLDRIEKKIDDCCGCVYFASRNIGKLANKFSATTSGFNLVFSLASSEAQLAGTPMRRQMEIKSTAFGNALWVPCRELPKDYHIAVAISPSCRHVLVEVLGKIDIITHNSHGKKIEEITTKDIHTGTQVCNLKGPISKICFYGQNEQGILKICCYPQ